jgi:hypothetical protein
MVAIRPWDHVDEPFVKTATSRLGSDAEAEVAAARRSAGCRWWARQGSNLRPTGYEPAALTAELRALGHWLATSV